MSPKSIRVGKTYSNRGAGTTFRTVLEIADQVDGSYDVPEKPQVKFSQMGRANNRLSLKSFAQWAGKEL